MSICSVCNRKVFNINFRIIRGASREWVCRDCLKKAKISVLKFSFVNIPSGRIREMIEGKKDAGVSASAHANRPLPLDVGLTNHENEPNLTEILVPERQEPQPRVLSACREMTPRSSGIAYFRNGELYDVFPRNHEISLDEDRQTAYSARFIVSDDIKYDLENPESIKSIKIPNFKSTSGMPYITRNMAYIIKMAASAEHRPHIAVPLVYKAANLMMACDIAWGKDEYYRIIKQLWLIGEIKYGDYLLSSLEKRVPYLSDGTYITRAVWENKKNLANTLNEDLWLIDYSRVACETCAIYQNRIYSYSGEDKRFPKLPDFIKFNGTIHHGSHNSIDSILFYDGFEMYKTVYQSKDQSTRIAVDPIEYSNRPFVDDRSDIEKQIFEEFEQRRDREKQAKEEYYDRNFWINEYYKHLEYQNIVDVMGDKAPKSYSAYRRMKKNNTANYQKILDIMNNGSCRN